MILAASVETDFVRPHGIAELGDAGNFARGAENRQRQEQGQGRNTGVSPLRHAIKLRGSGRDDDSLWWVEMTFLIDGGGVAEATPFRERDLIGDPLDSF